MKNSIREVQRMEMIDIHTHILPKLDDGAKDMDESIQMCRMGYQDGIRTFIVTPHILPGIYENDRSSILSKLQELNSKLDSEFRTLHPRLSILPGADVHFSPDILHLCQRGEILTFNDQGRFLMIEFPFQGIPFQAEEVLFKLVTRGIIPIISHPERNLEIRQRPKRYYEMIRMGCLGQVTAMSLTGGFGPGVRRMAEFLLSKRLIHLLASDAHSLDGRPPILSLGVRAAEKIIGREEAQKMVTENPWSLLEGRRPEVPEPISP